MRAKMPQAALPSGSCPALIPKVIGNASDGMHRPEGRLHRNPMRGVHGALTTAAHWLGRSAMVNSRGCRARGGAGSVRSVRGGGFR